MEILRIERPPGARHLNLSTNAIPGIGAHHRVIREWSDLRSVLRGIPDLASALDNLHDTTPREFYDWSQLPKIFIVERSGHLFKLAAPKYSIYARNGAAESGAGGLSARGVIAHLGMDFLKPRGPVTTDVPDHLRGTDREAGDKSGMAAGDEHPYAHTGQKAVADLIAKYGQAVGVSEHYGFRPIGPGDESVYLAVPADRFPPKPGFTAGEVMPDTYAQAAKSVMRAAEKMPKPVRYEWPDRVSFVTALSAALAVMAVRSTPASDGLRTPVETARQMADIIEKIALGQKVV